jgi:hypothetical protein
VRACGTVAHIFRPCNEPLTFVVRQKSARGASLRVLFLLPSDEISFLRDRHNNPSDTEGYPT